MRTYWGDTWNKMDLLTVGTLAVTVGLRLGLPDSTEAQIWARGCYSLVILLLWLRLLQIVRCDYV